MAASESKPRMTFESWVKTVPEDITSDPVWSMKAYRLALFAFDIGWRDVTRLMRDLRTRKLAGQLYDALGSVSANISEGYSRGSGKDRARFFEYALGSGREARGWYFGGRHVLGDIVARHRIGLLTEIIRLLAAMVPRQRGYTVHEEETEYGAADGGPIPW